MEEAALRGRAIHRYLQLAPEAGPAALEEAPSKYHAECLAIPLSDCAGIYTPPHLREIKLAHDANTGECRVLVGEGDRAYGDLTDEDTPGTADVVVRGFHTVEVHDYKTGRSPVLAKGNYQLLHLALMVVRTIATKAERIVLGIQRIRTDRRRKPVQARVETDVDVVDRWALDEYEYTQRRAMRLAAETKQAIDEGETPPVFPGVWCRYCDARPVCPVMKEK